MKVLIACEESQRVCISFRNKGHEAYSCDLMPCSGGKPEWHIRDDVRKVLKDDWNLVIAHPPCTYLCTRSNTWIKRFPSRQQDREKAIEFFLLFTKLDCPKVAIENPVGLMSKIYRKPDQYIQPYWFGDAESKKTGLWLKGLPLLEPINIVEPIMVLCKGRKRSLQDMTRGVPKKIKSVFRSKTYWGIAKAMADQWG